MMKKKAKLNPNHTMKEQTSTSVKPLKSYWVVVREGNVIASTIAYQRQYSKERFLVNYPATAKWDSFKKNGYRCIKVNIEFTQVN